MTKAPSRAHSRAQDLGRRGEDAAAHHLQSLGYGIVERNWRQGSLEIDLVAEHGETLVFAEVKARGPGSLAAPVQALTRAKQDALRRAAALYLSEHDLWHRPCRFDLVCVTAEADTLRVEHLEDVMGLEDAPAGQGGWQPW
jgi:putative endonuclease